MSKPVIKEENLKDNMEVINKHNNETPHNKAEYIPDFNKSTNWDKYDQKRLPTKLSFISTLKYLSIRTSIVEKQSNFNSLIHNSDYSQQTSMVLNSNTRY